MEESYLFLILYNHSACCKLTFSCCSSPCTLCKNLHARTVVYHRCKINIGEDVRKIQTATVHKIVSITDTISKIPLICSTSEAHRGNHKELLASPLVLIVLSARKKKQTTCRLNMESTKHQPHTYVGVVMGVARSTPSVCKSCLFIDVKTVLLLCPALWAGVCVTQCILVCIFVSNASWAPVDHTPVSPHLFIYIT